MAERGAGERRDGTQAARLGAALARAIIRPNLEGSGALRGALRDYVRSAIEDGLGAEAVLAGVDRAWRRGGATARRAVTRDVLEVAALLELSAGKDGSWPELPRG